MEINQADKEEFLKAYEQHQTAWAHMQLKLRALREQARIDLAVIDAAAEHLQVPVGDEMKSWSPESVTKIATSMESLGDAHLEVAQAFAAAGKTLIRVNDVADRIITKLNQSAG